MPVKAPAHEGSTPFQGGRVAARTPGHLAARPQCTSRGHDGRRPVSVRVAARSLHSSTSIRTRLTRPRKEEAMSLFNRITVLAHERALEYVDGVGTRVLEPGRYAAPARATYYRVDVRERIVTTAPQDVLTSDGVSVRVTAAVRWRVADARAFVEVVADASAVVYLAVQIALRDALAAVEVDALVRDARRLAGDPITAG